MQPEILVPNKTTFCQHPAVITVSFRLPPTSESVLSTLHRLQEVMKEFRHVMRDSTQKNLDAVIKYGVAVSELDPRSKAAFSVLSVTFELLKQQKGHDQMVSDLTRQLKRILPFAKKALKEAIEDNMDIPRTAIGGLYTLTMDIAEFSCDYVKRNRFKRLAKSVISTKDQDRINELTRGFKELLEDFDLAMNVEMFKSVRGTEERVLLDRLKPIETGYRLDRGCMEGTRTALLDDIVDWAIHPHVGDNVSATADSVNVYWLYGTSGVGKTAMAHSICARLHQEGILGGMFFCRRDNPDLSDPKSVLPTLVFKLAERRWSAFFGTSRVSPKSPATLTRARYRRP
ncbi:hypothetical protein FRC15_003237 [Serendipita sp. 397]|nr:hypothetical protein FRC15_003237 [Serendipita sp. 397]KAG8780891.1 hypothetical protein FRC16_002971 [Serendipita sp. 398]